MSFIQRSFLRNSFRTSARRQFLHHGRVHERLSRHVQSSLSSPYCGRAQPHRPLPTAHDPRVHGFRLWRCHAI
ncbi:hypothetical protein FKP32DRAFT_1431874 [Trametes sanguinea]|nr:hypothetical protein FKP32DRAFT_1431874 [Trametes sanguinea]